MLFDNSFGYIIVHVCYIITSHMNNILENETSRLRICQNKHKINVWSAVVSNNDDSYITLI